MRVAVLVAVFVLGVLGSTRERAAAAKLDCGQPLSMGDSPVTSDCLAILRAAVGQSIPTCSDEFFCICDVNGDGRITVQDALEVLRCAIGMCVCQDYPFCRYFDCQCEPDEPGWLPCTSAEIFGRSGSDIDIGWTGTSHDSGISHGDSITVRVKRECSNDGAECEHDDDCAGGTCEPTCNCNDDVTCEITGPTHQRKCRTDLEDCTTNADCDPDIPCVHTLGPPFPLSSGAVPVCVVNVFDGPITGTANSETGAAEWMSSVRSRVFFGLAADRPCPQCGAPSQDPQVGETFQCLGGQKPGATCIVEAVSADFGGTSSDCPPELNINVSGSGLAIRLQKVTTGLSNRVAQLPCKGIGMTANPLVPGSNPKCTDRTGSGDPVCTSNADCRRCSEDFTIACTNDTDCAGIGSCAEAPDQPVTCGYWCHCGFCDHNASLPCFETADCPAGQTCEAGTGAAMTTDIAQLRPNDCSNDGFVCGNDGNEEQCATTSRFTCSGAPFRWCETNADCETHDAGTCISEPRPCFEPRITRTGEPSPLGTYCAVENKTCMTNADCTQTGDFCAQDASRPQTVALFCVPAMKHAPIDNTSGITGPAAVRLNSFTQICRCGDGKIGCDEKCDDSNTANGDGCDDLCQEEVNP